MSENDANARFLRESIVEPSSIARARAHAVELGAAPISAAPGSQIAVLAAATGARSIVELGTGAGAECLRGGRMQAGSEPGRRGGGSAMVVSTRRR